MRIVTYTLCCVKASAPGDPGGDKGLGGGGGELGGSVPMSGGDPGGGGGGVGGGGEGGGGEGGGGNGGGEDGGGRQLAEPSPGGTDVASVKVWTERTAANVNVVIRKKRIIAEAVHPSLDAAILLNSSF